MYGHRSRVRGFNPIWITYSLDSDKYGMASLTSDHGLLKNSLVSREFEKNPKKVIDQLIKKLYTKKEENLKDKVKILGYHSKSFDQSMKRASIFERENFALYTCLTFFADYFEGNMVVALTDSLSTVQSLNGTVNTFKLSVKLSRIIQKITTQFPHIPVLHIKGENNALADMLSRLTGGKEERLFAKERRKVLKCGAIDADYYQDTDHYFNEVEKTFEQLSKTAEGGETKVSVNMIKKSDLDNVYDKYLSHTHVKNSYDQDFYEKVLKGQISKFSIKMGIIVDNASGLDVLPKELYQIYISYVHGLHSHRGQETVQRLIRENYFITDVKKLKQDIADFTNSCLNCQTGKPRNGLLFKGIIAARYPNQLASMDLIERPKQLSQSPKCLYASSVLLITDCYSKYITAYLLRQIWPMRWYTRYIIT